MNIAISSGHGLHVRGARSIIDEVEEARRVTNRVAEILANSGFATVMVFHENSARTQNDNVNAIIRHHNGQIRDLDVSVHFNSTATGLVEDRNIGVEVLFLTGNTQTRALAGKVARAISSASGLLLRHQRESGAVARNNLGFLTRTTAPSILIEVCFVNSRRDVALYQGNFENICHSIAEAISGQSILMQEAEAIFPLGNMPSLWAKESWKWGLTNGITDGTNPQGLPTREQLIQLLFNYHNTML